MSGATVAAVGMVAGGVASYQAAKKNNQAARRAADAANQPRTSTVMRTPYMNEYISQIAPYILQEAQSVYSNRSKGYGRQVGDFSQILGRLGQIPTNYSGVGGKSSGGASGPMSTEDRIAQDFFAKGRRAAWERNLPTDLGLGADQVHGPTRDEGLLGTPTMGSGSEIDMFSRRNVEAGARRENMDNLNSAANEVLYDQATSGSRPEGVTLKMPQLQLPAWLTRRRRKNQGSSAGFSLNLNSNDFGQ